MNGVVYTKDWVVRLVLDMAGYRVGHDLSSGVAVEPSCGCGAFLVEMVRRLVTSAHMHGTCKVRRLQPCIRAYDIDQTAVDVCKGAVTRELRDQGFTESDAALLASSWVHFADTLLADIPKADWVVGDPPYIRSSQIDHSLRERYTKEFQCATMGTDLYISFIEKGLRALTVIVAK